MAIREQATLLRPTQGQDKEKANLLLSRSETESELGDEDGQTPLSHAAGGGYLEVVRLLPTRSGVQADSRDKEGRTPLSHAAGGGHLEVVAVVDPKRRRGRLEG